MRILNTRCTEVVSIENLRFQEKNLTFQEKNLTFGKSFKFGFKMTVHLLYVDVHVHVSIFFKIWLRLVSIGFVCFQNILNCISTTVFDKVSYKYRHWQKLIETK